MAERLIKYETREHDETIDDDDIEYIVRVLENDECAKEEDAV